MWFKLNSQHNWEDLHDQLTSTRIYTFIVNKIFKLAKNIMRKMAKILIGFANHLELTHVSFPRRIGLVEQE